MDKKILLYLQIISTRGNINKLLREGIRYKDIPDITEQAIELGFIIYENEKIVVSPKGRLYLSKNDNILKEKNKDNWIDPAIKSQVSKIGKEDIFLPSQNELSF